MHALQSMQNIKFLVTAIKKVSITEAISVYVYGVYTIVITIFISKANDIKSEQCTIN